MIKAPAPVATEEDLQPGDLIFMKNPTDGIHHVVIYAGGGMVVEAANSKKGMKYRSLDEWRGEELLFAKVVKN